MTHRVTLPAQGARWHLGDFYYTCLDASPLQLVAGLLVYFIAVSLIFAGLFYAVPGDLQRNSENVTDFATFFYIALGIISNTAGSGLGNGVVGDGKLAVFLVCGIWQMISLAAFIALLVDRLTKPYSRIIFSKPAVLGTFNGQPALTFRLAHERRNVLLQAEVHLHSERGGERRTAATHLLLLLLLPHRRSVCRLPHTGGLGGPPPRGA